MEELRRKQPYQSGLLHNDGKTPGLNSMRAGRWDPGEAQQIEIEPPGQFRTGQPFWQLSRAARVWRTQGAVGNGCKSQGNGLEDSRHEGRQLEAPVYIRPPDALAGGIGDSP